MAALVRLAGDAGEVGLRMGRDAAASDCECGGSSQGWEDGTPGSAAGKGQAGGYARRSGWPATLVETVVTRANFLD